MSGERKGGSAIIAGSGKNLGALIAVRLAEQGFNIAFHYNSPSTKAKADATVAKVQSLGVKTSVFVGDLTSADAMHRFFTESAANLGVTSFDIAINTVGKVLKKPIVETTEAEYDTMFAVNSKAGFFFIKEAAAGAVKDGGCIISLVTSLLGAFARGYATYQGSKSPVEWFTKSAAKELQPRGIRVNCVAPGPMDTPFFYPQESDEAVAYHKSQALHNKLTDIGPIASLIDYLTKDPWITGQIIFSNGGYTTR